MEKFYSAIIESVDKKLRESKNMYDRQMWQESKKEWQKRAREAEEEPTYGLPIENVNPQDCFTDVEDV